MMDESTDVKSDWTVSDAVQKSLLGHLSDELAVAKENNGKVVEGFKVFYNMIHSVRNSKPNAWESDISLPEFLSRLLTQIGNFCAQMFSSTDYVETDIDSDDPKDIAEAKAAKKLLNVILKDPDTYFYHKIVRLINFVFACGYGIIKGGYEQRIVKEFSHMSQTSEPMYDELGSPMAEDGMPYQDPFTQQMGFTAVEVPQYVDKVEVDRPIFDVWPLQNVFMSPEYCYSLNDKEMITFQTEKTLSQLKAEKDQMGYFNLDFLEVIVPEGSRGDSTYNMDGDKKPQPEPPEKTYVLFERWGKYPVKEKDGEYLPAIDDQGKFEPDAELVECKIHYVQERESDTPKYVIGFRKSPHTIRPMARFLCYVDMVNDNGFGDGEVNRELQIAVDDNFNIGAFRTTMAAMPSFKGKKFAGIPDKVKVGPQHVTMVEKMDDLEQWIISDDPRGTANLHGLLTSRMDFAMATNPQTMGASADRAETATVGSIINQRANIRIGMKSMNLEFIGFAEFYRMLLTLCNDFMLPETLVDLVGEELAAAYNPKRKDKFRPLTQALETEETKQFNMKMLQGLWGMTVNVPNPNTPKVLNMIWAEIVDTMGSQHASLKKVMFEEDVETNMLFTLATGSKGMGTPAAASNPMQPPSNQNGVPQGAPEQATRQAAPGQ